MLDISVPNTFFEKNISSVTIIVAAFEKNWTKSHNFLKLDV